MQTREFNDDNRAVAFYNGILAGLSYKERAGSEHLDDGTYVYVLVATVRALGVMDGSQVQYEQRNPQRGPFWNFTVLFDDALKTRAELFERSN